MLTKTACAGLALGLILVTGCGSGDSQVPLAATPGDILARDDAYRAVGNALMPVGAAEGIRANDQHQGALVTPAIVTTEQGGQVDLKADGSFTYQPPAGFHGTDRFRYELGLTSTATVSIAVSGTIYFVRNTAPAGGDGSFASPFNTLAAALGQAQPGETIFVYQGDGTPLGLNRKVVLQNGQSLIGEGAGLTLDNGVNPKAEVVPPGGYPQMTGGIELASNSLVSGIAETGSNGTPAQIVAQGVDGWTISKCRTNYIAGFGVYATGGGTIEGNEFVGGDGGIWIASLDDPIAGRFVLKDNVIIDDGSGSPGVLGQGIYLNCSGNLEIALSGNTITGAGGWLDLLADDPFPGNNRMLLTCNGNTFQERGVQINFASILNLSMEENKVAGGLSLTNSGQTTGVVQTSTFGGPVTVLDLASSGTQTLLFGLFNCSGTDLTASGRGLDTCLAITGNNLAAITLSKLGVERLTQATGGPLSDVNTVTGKVTTTEVEALRPGACGLAPDGTF